MAREQKPPSDLSITKVGSERKGRRAGGRGPVALEKARLAPELVTPPAASSPAVASP